LGHEQLLDAAVDDVDFVGQFLVASVGPKFETSIVEVLDVGVLELGLQNDFHVRNVFAGLLHVILLQFCQVALCRNRQRLQPPNLLPHPRALFVALDVGPLGILVDPDAVGFREQFALELGEI